MAPSTSFPVNQWYVAAYRTEITNDLFSRTICGALVVFYRDSAGAVVALADRCVHRRFPLSQCALPSWLNASSSPSSFSGTLRADRESIQGIFLHRPRTAPGWRYFLSAGRYADYCAHLVAGSVLV